MKKIKIVFWITTAAIFLFEGVMPALTSHSQLAISGITHLGYPLYFVNLLTAFKVLGAIVLIVPKFPRRMKEWAYAGFTLDFISAFVSIWAVDGLRAMTFFPLVVLAVLVVSYICYDKLNQRAA